MFEDLNPKPESFAPSSQNQEPGQPVPGEAPDAPETEFDRPPEIPLDEPLPSPESAELEEWKEALREDFERWLESVDEWPSVEESGLEAVDTPDLRSFYEQLAAAGTETRKANRRTAEAFSQWGDTLSRFESQLKPLRETILELQSATLRDNRLSNAYCLVWIEMLDRLYRLAAAFCHAPPKAWWGNDSAWRQAWETQRQGFDILLGHMESFLKKEGVERMATVGQPFDPTLMAAAAVEENSQLPHHTVVEEITPGYRRQGELLRAAQVKVTINKSKP